MTMTIRIDANRVTIRRAAVQAARKKRKLPQPPASVFPKNAEKRYMRDLKEYARGAEKLMREIVLPEIPRIFKEAKSERPAIKDDSIDEINQLMNQLRFRISREYTEDEIREMANRMGRSVSDVTKMSMERQWRRVLGIDLFSRDQGLREFITQKAKMNVQLIQSIPSRYYERLQNGIMNSVTQGIRVEEVEAQINEMISKIGGDMDTNAELIARDQVGKLNGDITEFRQKELGVERYVWRTVKDERVRETHAELDGETFSWDDPPVINEAGERGHPGDDIQCRCYAEPVLEDIL